MRILIDLQGAQNGSRHRGIGRGEIQELPHVRCGTNGINRRWEERHERSNTLEPGPQISFGDVRGCRQQDLREI